MLISKPASRIPGDTARITTRPATSTSGVTYPAGTRYTPLSAGVGGQEVVIAGRRVIFP